MRENTYTTRILKWETKQWGEIPADFGRKIKNAGTPDSSSGCARVKKMMRPSL